MHQFRWNDLHTQNKQELKSQAQYWHGFESQVWPGIFPQSQLPVQTVLRCPDRPRVQLHSLTFMRTLKSLNTGSHTFTQVRPPELPARVTEVLLKKRFEKKKGNADNYSSLHRPTWKSTNKGVNQRSKHAPQTQQQRPGSPTVTLAWHASKYKVHKLHRKCILGRTSVQFWFDEVCRRDSSSCQTLSLHKKWLRVGLFHLSNVFFHSTCGTDLTSNFM